MVQGLLQVLTGNEPEKGKTMKITVAGVGYVGLSLAVLLSQHHEVTAITTTAAKAEKLNRLGKAPFRTMRSSDSLQRRRREAELNLHTTTDKAAAYARRSWSSLPRPPTTTARRTFSTPQRGRRHRTDHGGQSGCPYGHQEHHPGGLHGVRAQKVQHGQDPLQP